MIDYYITPDEITRFIFKVFVFLAFGLTVLAIIFSSGCITLAKENIASLTATPEPTPTPTLEPTPTPEPTSTPTPEPTLSQEQYMGRYGGLPMGQWLSWKRENVSGYRDMSAHVTVYGWREHQIIDWYSVSWGQYFRQGAGVGNKFLFVHVASYTDEGSARMWGIQPSQFLLDVNGTIYKQTEELLPEIRLLQYTDVYDYDHVAELGPYGYIRTYSDAGTPIAISQGFLKAGRSNMWSGYIPFIVPRETRISEVKVLFNGHSLTGNKWWQLE